MTRLVEHLRSTHYEEQLNRLQHFSLERTRSRVKLFLCVSDPEKPSQSQFMKILDRTSWTWIQLPTPFIAKSASFELLCFVYNSFWNHLLVTFLGSFSIQENLEIHPTGSCVTGLLNYSNWMSYISIYLPLYLNLQFACKGYPGGKSVGEDHHLTIISPTGSESGQRNYIASIKDLYIACSAE